MENLEPTKIKGKVKETRTVTLMVEEWIGNHLYIVEKTEAYAPTTSAKRTFEVIIELPLSNG